MSPMSTEKRTPWSLGDLIDGLRSAPSENRLLIAGPLNLVPCGVDSYRGFYHDLAIEFTPEGGVTVGQFLDQLERAVGTTFGGYKGGEYPMDQGSNIWVSNYGEVSNMGVSGIQEDYGTTYILTARVSL